MTAARVRLDWAVPVRWAFTAAAAAVAGEAIGHGTDWRLVVGGVAAAGLAAVGGLDPLAFIAVFLLVRPCLDSLADESVGIGGSLGNLAGLTGLLVLAVAGMTIFTLRRVIRPDLAITALAVLAVSAAAAVWARLELHGAIGAKPLSELIRLAALAAAYLLVTQLVTRPDQVRRLMFLAGLSAVVPALIGIYQWMHGVPHATGLDISRIDGTFTGPNPFAMYLAASALILIAVPRAEYGLWLRSVAVVPILVALVGTFSRTGWILFALGVVLLGWRTHRRLLLALAVCALAAAVIVPSVRHRIVPSGGGYVPSSYQWRVDTWKVMLRKYEQKPVTGFGLRSAPIVDPRQYVIPGQTPVGYDPHNTGVKLLVEGGPLLLFVWIALLAAAVRRIWRALASPALAREASIVLVLLTTLAFTGVTADDPLAATALMFMLAVLVGAVEAGTRVRA